MKNLKYIAIALLVLCLMPVGARAAYDEWTPICAWDYNAESDVVHAAAEKKFSITLYVANFGDPDSAMLLEYNETFHDGQIGVVENMPSHGAYIGKDFAELLKRDGLVFQGSALNDMSFGKCPASAVISKDGEVCISDFTSHCWTYMSGIYLFKENLSKLQSGYGKFKDKIDGDVFKDIEATAENGDFSKLADEKTNQRAEKNKADKEADKNKDENNSGNNNSGENSDSNVDFNLEGRDGCAVFGSLTDELASIYNTIRLLMVGALVVFTIVDFTKAMASAKDDALTKPFKHLIIRFVIIIAMFVVPLLIQLLLGIFFGGNWQACLTGF